MFDIHLVTILDGLSFKRLLPVQALVTPPRSYMLESLHLPNASQIQRRGVLWMLVGKVPASLALRGVVPLLKFMCYTAAFLGQEVFHISTHRREHQFRPECLACDTALKGCSIRTLER